MPNGNMYHVHCRSLAAADIDGDGNTDVAIGAPGFSKKENMMAGRVYVLYSKR